MDQAVKFSDYISKNFTSDVIIQCPHAYIQQYQGRFVPLNMYMCFSDFSIFGLSEVAQRVLWNRVCPSFCPFCPGVSLELCHYFF